MVHKAFTSFIMRIISEPLRSLSNISYVAPLHNFFLGCLFGARQEVWAPRSSHKRANQCTVPRSSIKQKEKTRLCRSSQSWDRVGLRKVWKCAKHFYQKQQSNRRRVKELTVPESVWNGRKLLREIWRSVSIVHSKLSVETREKTRYVCVELSKITDRSQEPVKIPWKRFQ